MKAKLEEDDRRPSFEFRCRSIATYAMRHQNLTSKFPANLHLPQPSSARSCSCLCKPHGTANKPTIELALFCINITQIGPSLLSRTRSS